MNRREFNKAVSFAGLALVTGGSIALTGCNAVTDLENWIPVALTSVAAITKLLGAVVPGPVTAAIALITSGLSALLTALKNYKAGTGVLSDVANAINDVENAFANFFSSLSVPTALLNTIEGLANILISTLEGFANSIIPSTQRRPQFKLAGNTMTVNPVKRSIAKYRSDWNAECATLGHPEAEI